MRDRTRVVGRLVFVSTLHDPEGEGRERCREAAPDLEGRRQPREAAAVHRHLQEALAALELSECAPVWPVWEHENVAFRLLNEPSQSLVWQIAAPKLAFALSRRRTAWDFRFERSAVLWGMGVTRVVLGSVTSLKEEDQKIEEKLLEALTLREEAGRGGRVREGEGG